MCNTICHRPHIWTSCALAELTAILLIIPGSTNADISNSMPPKPMFDTPPLRVSRPIAACAPCRRTKSKCDGKLPVCSSCEKSGKADQCASNSSDTRETSYVATLETRKAVLEKAYAEASTRRKSLIGLIEATGDVPSRRASTTDTSSSRKRADGKKEATNVDDLVGDFGLMYGPTSKILDYTTKKQQVYQCYFEGFLWVHTRNLICTLHPLLCSKGALTTSQRPRNSLTPTRGC